MDMPHTQIEVRFIDASTGAVFIQTQMPVENLPQSFERQTTFHIGEQDWSVVKAEPMTAEEFMRTGKLTLALQRIQHMSPQDILFILPTLCDEIPGLTKGKTKQDKRVLEMHED